MNMRDPTVQWQAEENAVRARLVKTAVYARADQVAGRTGLEVFEAIFSGELPRPPIGYTRTRSQPAWSLSERRRQHSEPISELSTSRETP